MRSALLAGVLALHVGDGAGRDDPKLALLAKPEEAAPKLPSALPEATVLPRGENASDWTKSVCPRRVARHAPRGKSRRGAAAHSRIVLSQLPEARSVPSGENTTLCT